MSKGKKEMKKNLPCIALAFPFAVLIFCLSERTLGQETKVSAAKISIAAGLLDYHGRCPVEIRLTGSITTTGAGVVRYQFVHSSGQSGPVQQLASPRQGQYEVSESPIRTMGPDAPSWNDRVVIRILSNPGGPFDTAEIKYGGACDRVNAVAPTATITLGPAHARFRVTLNGFTCNSPTNDTSILGDGAGDEVYLFTKIFNVQMPETGSFPVDTAPQWTRTREYGDTSSGSFPQRIRAGSSRNLGASGGIVAGDSFPESPQKHSTDPQSQTLPQLVWEGTIARRVNAVVVIPTIWESDGRTDLLYGRWQAQGLGASLNNVGRLIRDPALTDQNIAKMGIRSDITGQTRISARIGDMPIGMMENGDGLRADMLILTYDEAMRMVQLSINKNGEAFPIIYTSSSDLGGRYTLYLQVERLPN